MIELNAATIAGGRLVERLNDEIQKAVANCLDINRPKKRGLFRSKSKSSQTKQGVLSLSALKPVPRFARRRPSIHQST